jgi:FAD/FMN-containing dehydrogenase
MSDPIGELARFAADEGLELREPETTGDFPSDPSIDYGRVVRRVPRAVARPRDQAQLVALVRRLGEGDLPWVVRGAGHSSGGQSLVEGGVVVDLGGLARIVDDDPAGETVTCEAGAFWLALVEQLRPQGRRPRALTANLRSSVGGTLAVGGFGDASHLDGLQIDHVRRLVLVTPDGVRRELGPADPLFRYTLAGRGQLGVMTEVTLATVTRPMVLAARQLRWGSLGEYLRDAAVIATYGLYDFLRARIALPGGGISAWVGRSQEDLAPEPGLALLRPSFVSPQERLDLHELLTRPPTEAWRKACPALEIVLPLPEGVTAWQTLAPLIADAGIPERQPLGHAVMVVRGDRRLPLAPLPGGTSSLMIALRPEMASGEVAAFLPPLEAIGQRAIALGARIYLMSIELGGLATQLGVEHARWRALKAEVDPKGLLAPGLLTR